MARRDRAVEHHPEGAGIVRADGSEPAAPLADADCQAAAVAALDALDRLDPGAGWGGRAAALRGALAGWGPEEMAIEGDGTIVPGAGSQLGWLLWAGALEGDAADAAAERLVAPDVLTDHGLRTLSSAHPAFRPRAYHRGGVWPFDCWLGWGGLRAAGRPDAAERVRTGVLAALDRLGRAPELYAVTPDGALEPIPVANRVQAWTVGARWALEHGWDGRPGCARSSAAAASRRSPADLDVALDAGVGERHLAGPGALEEQVHPRVADPQPAHLHPVEPARQRRTAHAQPAVRARRAPARARP